MTGGKLRITSDPISLDIGDDGGVSCHAPISLDIGGDNGIVHFDADEHGVFRGPTAGVGVDPLTREVREAWSTGDAGAAALPGLVAELRRREEGGE